MVFTGDRVTDRILNIWFKWYKKRDSRSEGIEDLDDKKIDELIYRVGLEDFVNYVLEEFPQMSEVGFDYDAEYTWEMFLKNTKVGYDVEEALSEFLEDMFQVDNDLILEYIDDDYIAESFTTLDNFFELNPIGKKMRAKDKRIMIQAFEEGTCESFTNGWSFSPSEYVEVIMSEKDDENHTYEDIRKELNNYKVWAKKGYLIMDGYIYNPHLYNGEEVHCCFTIDAEEIAKHADLKGKHSSEEDDENVIPF